MLKRQNPPKACANSPPICIPFPALAPRCTDTPVPRHARVMSQGRLTLPPVSRLVGEEGLAAGVPGEAAILHAEGVELGELLTEHSAQATARDRTAWDRSAPRITFQSMEPHAHGRARLA